MYVRPMKTYISYISKSQLQLLRFEVDIPCPTKVTDCQHGGAVFWKNLINIK